MKKAKKKFLSLAVGAVILGCSLVISPALTRADEVMWINHLDFLAGDPSVLLSFNAVNSGVGGGLSGLIINSTTVGEEAEGGGNKVIQKGLIVPPGLLVNGVRVCYELSSTEGYISQIRLAQVQDPPQAAVILLDDGTDLTDQGPVCVDSAAPFSGPIDPTAGPVLLSFRVNFTTPSDDISLGDTIVIRGVGLNVSTYALDDLQQQIDDIQDNIENIDDGLQQQIDELQDNLQNHAHKYLTGRGVGHNKKVVTSGAAIISSEPIPEVVPWKGKAKPKKKK